MVDFRKSETGKGPSRPLASPLLIIVGAALLAVASVSRAWWVLTEGELQSRVGLRIMELCREGSCTQRGLEYISESATGWAKMAASAWALALFAALSLLLCAVFMVRGRGVPSGFRFAAGLCLVSGVVAAMAVATAPFAGHDMGWAPFAYFGGAAAGFLVTALHSRKKNAE